jgi:MFS family permease
MFGFIIVWLGQMISVLATNMSQFALTIWAYEKTGSATALTLMQVFFITPFLLISPFAGSMVDRYNRKLMMMVSDLGGGLATIGILGLQALGLLEIWHLYVASVIFGLTNAFQWPAYSAAISVMVTKEQYGRANGLMSLVEMGPGVVAPLAAGALLPLIGFTGILTIDVVTFILAVGALLVVHIPQPPRTAEGQQAEDHSLWQDAQVGFRYIFARPSLLGLQMTFFFANLFAGLAFAVMAPMILARTGNNETIFGLVQSAGAIGGIAGGVLMSMWGGFKRRVHGILAGWIFTGVVGIALFGLGRDLWVWLPTIFLGSLLGPIMNGSSQAIWQSKVAPDLQGRVFSARRLIAWFAGPVTALIAGPLADFVLEPQMRVDTSALATATGWLVGTGPGAGMALIFVIAGVCAMLVGVAGYLNPVVRNAEALIPDHDAVAPAQPAPAAAD